MAKEDECGETQEALRSCDAIGEALRHAGFSIDSPPTNTELETLRACYIDNLRRWNSALIAENESLRKARDEAIAERDAARGKLNESLDDAIAARVEARAAEKTMTFGAAIEDLKAGRRVSRAGWNGKGMWLRLVTENQSYLPGLNLYCLPFIAMKTADDKLVPWLASQTDMLAEDWERVNAT